MKQVLLNAFPKLLLLVAALIWGHAASAQGQDKIWNFEEKCVLEFGDVYCPLNPKGEFGADSQPTEMIAFSHLAAVRKKPAAEADIVSRVPIGEEVEVLAFLDVKTTVEGVEAPWCEVKYKGKKGFMWTGALTTGAIKLSDGSYACWGLARIINSEDGYESTASVRRFKDGQQLQRLEVGLSNLNEYNFGQLQLWCAPALDSVKNVIQLSVVTETSGNYNMYNYFTWDGKNLKFIDFGYSRGDENMFEDSRKVTFPYPDFVSPERQRQLRAYPARNQIMIREAAGEWDEDCLWTEQSKLKFRAWPSLLPEGCE